MSFWCGRDAGVKWPGGVETGSVKGWAAGAAGCTEVVCRGSSQGWPEASRLLCARSQQPETQESQDSPLWQVRRLLISP